jgi:PIN domain nuclease of toxin-antitoxin system
VRLLLDTSTLFWWLIDEAQLSPTAYGAIRAKDNEVYVSIASAWEMAIKVGLGKWPEARALLSDF